MDNKIALFGAAEKQKQIENVLSKYLKENNLSSEIHQLSDSEKFLRELWFKNDFRLIMICEKGTITYLLKIYKNFDRQAARYYCGKLKYPLTKESLTNQIFEVLKSSHLCPYGVYAAKNSKMSRLIQHQDIECIFKKQGKSVFLLSSRDMVTVPDAQSRILSELDANYFIKCRKGFIVNFFNVKQIGEGYKSLILNSGVEIPMSSNGQKQFFKALSLSITGVNPFYY